MEREELNPLEGKGWQQERLILKFQFGVGKMKVGAGAREKEGMDGKRLRGQEGGFGCGGEMLYFEKKFCKLNKMRLFKNKNEMRGKSMMNR